MPINMRIPQGSPTIGTKTFIGRANNFRVASSGGISVPTDGPGNVYVPSTISEVSQLSIANPNSIWTMQETSGDLSDSAGAVSLTPNGTPLYNQTISGWARKAIGFNNTANQRFSVVAGTYDPSVSSSAILVYLLLTSVASTPRIAWVLGSTAANPLQMNFNTSGNCRITNLAATLAGSYDYRDGAVHPFLFVYDRTNSLVRVYTDKEQINGTYGAGVADGTKGPGTGSSGTSPTCNQLIAYQWYGSSVLTLGKSTLSQLNWSLAY